MVIKLLQTLLLTFILLLFLSDCKLRKQKNIERGSTSTSTSKAIIPLSEKEVFLSNEKIDGLDEEEPFLKQTPRISLESNESLLSLDNVNLDIDNIYEQIIATSDTKNPENLIKLIVVDFDEIRNNYFPACYFLTQAAGKSAFKIQAYDLTGNYNKEIICRGFNLKGELTLDVFRKTTSPSGSIYFSPIFKGASNHTITIKKHKRSQSYQLGQKHGESFPIIIERREKDSKNSLDIIKETYYWKYQEKRYFKAFTKKIPGNVIVQKQLREFFSGQTNRKDFERFLAGPWYLQDKADCIVVFDTENSIISFYDGNILENYKIINFYQFGYRLSIIARNTVINSIRKWMNITLQSMNSIELGIQDSDLWDGRYRRITKDLHDSFFKNTNNIVKSSKLVLEGVYKNNEGLKIAFELPYFTWIEKDSKSSSGGFSILSNVSLLNGFYLEREIPDRVKVITFRFLKENGVFIKDNSFVLEYNEKQEDNKIIKTIIFTACKLNVKGAELISKDSIKLEHLEIIDKN